MKSQASETLSCRCYFKFRRQFCYNRS